MLFQYLCNIESLLPTVKAHFMRGGPGRFAAAFRESCFAGEEESTSYHELAMRLAERTLGIVRGCIGGHSVAVEREDLDTLESLPCDFEH